jgi:hypothetical protein
MCLDTLARMPSPVPGDADEFTIDELAVRTGLTVRTLRFYANAGLLPAPQRRGRIAYYSAQHRMRLDLVRTLQKHGYTLAAISRVLARIPLDARVWTGSRGSQHHRWAGRCHQGP